MWPLGNIPVLSTAELQFLQGWDTVAFEQKMSRLESLGREEIKKEQEMKKSRDGY